MEQPIPDIFDPEFVRAQGILALKEMEDRHNFKRKQHYLLAIANWKRNNPVGKTPKAPVPQPPLTVHYHYPDDEIHEDVETTFGPDRVAEPYIPPEPPTPAEGVVAFGPAVEDGTGAYLVARENTVPPGTHAVKDGNDYVFVVLGRLGTLTYRKLWIPTGK